MDLHVNNQPPQEFSGEEATNEEGEALRCGRDGGGGGVARQSVAVRRHRGRGALARAVRCLQRYDGAERGNAPVWVTGAGGMTVLR